LSKDEKLAKANEERLAGAVDALYGYIKKPPNKQAQLKAKGQKQPQHASPSTPPPSSCFGRQEVRLMQGLFRTISRDGVMGPAEWTRCLGHLGVENEITSLRLFDMFDASGDKELNAKEFSFGLSDICNSFQNDTAPDDVRRNFAFRFYVSGSEGLFKEAECRSFLSSYRLSASRCVFLTRHFV
jgi:hypothetical protein